MFSVRSKSTMTRRSPEVIRSVSAPSSPVGGGSAPVATRGFKRPSSFVAFMVVWGAVAAYDLLISFILYGPQDSFYLQLGPHSVYALIVQDITLRIFLQVVSIVQLLAIYGLWKGSPWAYFAGLGIPTFVLLTFGGIASLYYSAPVRDGLRTPLLYETLFVVLAFAVLTWVYISRPSVKRYLTRWI